MSLRPTITTNRFHFSDLDPTRFEEICYMLVRKSRQWLELIHLGRSGSDGGIDIKGTLQVQAGTEIWLIQCKRYRSIGLPELKEMADKILANHTMPDKMMLIVSCEVSRAKYDAINAYCSGLGIPQLILWTDTTLEAMLYEHPEIKTIAFGEERRTGNPSVKNAQKISRGLRMQKRLEKALLNKKVIGNPAYLDQLARDPSLKFISEDVYIRSVDDQTYPYMPEKEYGKISPWFRSFFYDFYHNGIELFLSAGIGADIIMNKEGFWEHVRSDDPRKKNPLYRVIRAKTIGRIPFSGITDFLPDGDNHFNSPHLFCLYDHDGMPYEEIYYKYDDGKERLFGNDLPREKKIEFPAE